MTISMPHWRDAWLRQPVLTEILGPVARYECSGLGEQGHWWCSNFISCAVEDSELYLYQGERDAAKVLAKVEKRRQQRAAAKFYFRRDYEKAVWTINQANLINEKALRNLARKIKSGPKPRSHPLKKYSGPPRTGYVYFLRDRRGRLLYVGKTWSIEQRLYGFDGHATRKPWWPEVARIDVREYRTEQDALAAEAVQIARLLPPKNIAIPRNPPARAPRAVRRFTETPRQVSP